MAGGAGHGAEGKGGEGGGIVDGLFVVRKKEMYSGVHKW